MTSFPQIHFMNRSYSRLSRKVDFNHNLWWRILLICSIHKLVFFVSSVQNFLISLRKFSLPDPPRGSCRITISQQIVSPCFFFLFQVRQLAKNSVVWLGQGTVHYFWKKKSYSPGQDIWIGRVFFWSDALKDFTASSPLKNRKLVELAMSRGLGSRKKRNPVQKI